MRFQTSLLSGSSRTSCIKWTLVGHVEYQVFANSLEKNVFVKEGVAFPPLKYKVLNSN